MSNQEYEKALLYLYGLQKYGIKFGLSKTSNIMDKLGNPHHGQRYIHIAGTNGKGSVSAVVESILVRAGMKVGFYSSPHLVRFTERFRINREEMPPKRAVELTNELRGIISPDHPPTYFEVTTAMALAYFAREKCDIAIMEVGMGGRLDATNIIHPLVSAITNISLEHQFFLGNRLLDIAGEKAGIIKKGVDLVTAATQPSVIRFLENTCAERGAPFRRVGEDVRYRNTGSGLFYYGLTHILKGLDVGLKGGFQARNTTLGLLIIEMLEEKGLDISHDNIVEGLRKISWPGRMHIISNSPLIVLDGAHNPRAIRELAVSVEKKFSYKNLILIIGIMEDKDIGRIMAGIMDKAGHVICTRPDYYRSAAPEKLMGHLLSHGKQGETISSIPQAVERAKQVAGPEDMILITGSLFTVGEALTYFDPVKYKPDGV